MIREVFMSFFRFFGTDLRFRVFKPIRLDPLTIWNVFGNYLRWETNEKVDLVNSKRPIGYSSFD